MKKSIVKIQGNKYIYKNKVFESLNLFKSINLSKNILILLLNENIYVRKQYIDINKIDEEEINKIKESEFGKGEEYLIHYEICKKDEILYMYAVTGGIKVLEVCKDAQDIEVVPMQIYLIRFLNKKIKEEKYGVIVYYLDVYYYIIANNGYIERSFVSSDLKDIISILNEDKSNNRVYVQDGIKFKYVNKNITYLELRGFYSEKIFI